MRSTLHLKPLGLASVLLSLAVVSSAVAQQPPVIRTQPTSQTVEAGTDVTFEVDVNGHRPISYLWRLNGIALPAAINSALTLREVQCPDAGTYSVVASNSLGSVTSDGALLIVLDAIPPTILCPPNRTVRCMADVPPDTNAVQAADHSGRVLVTHQGDQTERHGCIAMLTRTYRASDLCGNFSECTQFITVTNADALLIICPSNITVGCRGDVPVPDPSSVRVSTSCNGVRVTHAGDVEMPNGSGMTINRYYAVIDSCSNRLLCTQSITVLGLPPRIFLGASVDDVEGGKRIDYQAFVNGTPPFQFEWAFSDGFITNTTTSTVRRIYGPFDRIPGDVQVTVTNPCGIDRGALYFFPPEAPIALSRGVPLSRTGTIGSGAGPPCPAFLTSCGSFGANAKWFKMSSQDGGTATISTEGSDYDTMLGVYTGSIFDPCHLVLLGCNDDINATNKQSRVRFPVNAFAPYWLVVAGSNANILRLTYGFEPIFDSFRVLPSRSFEVRSINVPAFSYRLLGSTDLQTWQTLFSTNLTTRGDLYFTEPMTPMFRHRFYRFVFGP